MGASFLKEGVLQSGTQDRSDANDGNNNNDVWSMFGNIANIQFGLEGSDSLEQ